MSHSLPVSPFTKPRNNGGAKRRRPQLLLVRLGHNLLAKTKILRTTQPPLLRQLIQNNRLNPPKMPFSLQRPGRRQGPNPRRQHGSPLLQLNNNVLDLLIIAK